MKHKQKYLKKEPKYSHFRDKSAWKKATPVAAKSSGFAAKESKMLATKKEGGKLSQ